MAAEFTVLEQVRVASPCHAAWDRMQGDEQVRFCGECRKHVYNLSAISRSEAEALLLEKEGSLCIRLYRRRDGTLITNNCPVGLRRARRWLALQMSGIAGAFGLLALVAPLVKAEGLVKSEAFQRVRHSRLAQAQPLRSFFDWVDPAPPYVMMGAMAAPSRPLMTGDQ